MRKELKDKRLAVLLSNDVQEEMELRARLGLKKRPELNFYAVAASKKTKVKSDSLRSYYIFVTTNDKKAQRAGQIIADELKKQLNKNRKDWAEQDRSSPKFDILFEIQESKLLLLSPDRSENFESFKNEFQKTSDLLYVEAEKRLSVLNKGILHSAMKTVRTESRNQEYIQKVKNNLIKRLYRAQIHGKDVQVQVYDKNAPSKEQVVLQSQQKDRTRER